MPYPHLTMRNLRDVLRLVLRDNLSRRKAAISLSLPRSSVGDYVRRAIAAGLTWEMISELDDSQLEARLFSKSSTGTSHPQPDFPLIKKELRRKGVTLALLWLEYLELNPGGNEYSQFCNLYQTWRRPIDVVMVQEH